MDDLWMRVAGALTDRLQGPLHFRFLLQPIVASVLAIRSGLQDARARRPPYFWTLLTKRRLRGPLVKDGWKSVGKVFMVALALDIVYQVIVFRFVYSSHALVVGFVLTIAPYLILRGVTNRLVSGK
jgi:hypothetical protein